jgi:hypothetical protein
MRSHNFVVAAAPLFLFVSCGDLEVRSIRTDEAVPASLEGEWTGSWTSLENNTTGALTVRLQEFDHQPVVSMEINNPCLVPQSYELQLAGGTIELRAGGVPVLDAVVDAEARTLTGNYNCAADRGTWQASWVRELPELLDLSGEWAGTVTVAGPVSTPLEVHFEQNVRAGALVLDGLIELPEALALPVPISGFVRFRDDDFELILQTLNGYQPAVVMTGIGDRAPLQVDFGVFQVLSTQALPFSLGLFQIAPVE